MCSEAYAARRSGAHGGENVGMSNHKRGESPLRRKPKVSSAMSIIGGLGVPKDNRAFGHGKPMDSRLIFRPLHGNRWSDGRNESERIIGFAFLRRRVVLTENHQNWLQCRSQNVKKLG
ncbi:MAG: hypothetical protein A3A33_04640 [Candidatus Yanofskybacteria bacterium RIFCSPLOWO2_01_FULL_49_25]|uniref:Uncharacterized protein n=1 Tax=Candidatus Yanofskybacteria bacterium RIFCSPLOWO2_01_FULL_49_25 TaxID=1802701 RepID=A0A1F8GQ03_9BACT|nr:MAG: hypothetical protein A3A33_04640 [Candidatus Yanofskybacteria bacterium RIFCSPLOWO2_01_FULL_49_25]